MAVQQDLPLMSTVAVGLSLAFIFGLIASKLRIPPIVGYLLAGIIIGPQTPGFVADIDLANELAEIGVVLLMFGVGLHFSIKDLLEVKNIAMPGAIVQILTATVMGAGLVHFLWDWSLSSSLMFGLSLSVASTVVLLRALEEHSLSQSMNGRIAIGWLIVEDLAMVLALVMIPALAGSEEGVSGGPLQHIWVAAVKLIVFVIIMLVAGKRFLPWLLALATKTRSRELFTLAVFAVAVGMAFGASKLFGVSFALGAFFAGMMIRESDLNHEVADRALPFQDAFAVLFFVAVGMLFNPYILIEQPLNVMMVVAIIMIGKSLAAFGIVMLFGYPLKTGLLVSAGLAQIGEFSFILAGLGLTYGLLPIEGQNMILAGAMISIALNPVMFYGSRKLYEFAGRNTKISCMFNMREDDLSQLTADEQKNIKDPVILAGYGRVGMHICDNIKAANIDLIIVDSNRGRIEMLRETGHHAIAGDATYPETLQDSGIDQAVALCVAVPDPFEARKIVEAAKSLRPDIKILVHAHNDEEMYYFEEQNIDLVLTGPREIGRRMVEYLKGSM